MSWVNTYKGIISKKANLSNSTHYIRDFFHEFSIYGYMTSAQSYRMRRLQEIYKYILIYHLEYYRLTENTLMYNVCLYDFAG